MYARIYGWLYREPYESNVMQQIKSAMSLFIEFSSATDKEFRDAFIKKKKQVDAQGCMI